MDRFAICAAYYIIASRYHTGQDSKGYAKLSQVSRCGWQPGRGGWDRRRGSEERNAAAALLRSRRKEILTTW